MTHRGGRARRYPGGRGRSFFSSQSAILSFHGRQSGNIMVTLTEHPDGWIIRVRAMPGARRAGVQGEQSGALKVAVHAPAQDGRANKALVETLREALGLKRSQIELVSGATSREKTMLIRGVTKAELKMRIDAVVSE